MPKSSKSTKSKSFVSTVKKQSKLKLGFLGLSIVLLLTTLGYVGFSAYKVQNLNANAAGYKVLAHDPGKGFMIRTCKIYTIYGYNLRVVYNKPRTTPSGSKAHAEIFSGTSKKSFITSRMSQSWWGNEITVIDIPAGKYDYHTLSIYTTINRQNWAMIAAGSLSSTPNC